METGLEGAGGHGEVSVYTLLAAGPAGQRAPVARAVRVYTQPEQVGEGAGV